MGIISFHKSLWLQPNLTKRTLAASTSATPSGSSQSCTSPCHSTISGHSSDNTTPSGSGGDPWPSSQHTSKHGTDLSDQRSVVTPSTDKSSPDKPQSSTIPSSMTEKTKVSTSTELE